MKSLKYTVFVFLIGILSCNKDEIVSENIVIETQSVISTEKTRAEVVIELFNLKSEIKEAGVVFAQKSNPTISDRKVSINAVKYSQSFNFNIEDLQTNGTYYIRAFYANVKNEIIYGNELILKQNFPENWLRVKSPEVATDEYIYTGNVNYSFGSGGIQFTRVNPTTNRGTYTYFFPNFFDWDPRFFQLEREPFNVRFNQFQADIVSAKIGFIVKGGGYQKLDNGSRFYLKDFSVLGTSGYKYDPQYPGDNVDVNAFGIEKDAYVIENKPNGVLWRFDFELLKWFNMGNIPFKENNVYKIFKIKNRIFAVVEPLNIKASSPEFFEIIPITNTWIKKKDFPGTNRRYGAVFSLNNLGYYGCGQSSQDQSNLKDFWSYNTETDSWNKSFNYPGIGSIDIAAVVSDRGVFFGFGQSVLISNNKGEKFKNANDFWVFSPKN